MRLLIETTFWHLLSKIDR